jgi:hypothetical protein
MYTNAARRAVSVKYTQTVFDVMLKLTRFAIIKVITVLTATKIASAKRSPSVILFSMNVIAEFTLSIKLRTIYIPEITMAI